MKSTMTAARLLFMILAMATMVTYTSQMGDGSGNLAAGLVLGGALSLCLLGLDSLMRMVRPRTINTLTLGLLFGLAFGAVLNLYVGKVLAAALGSVSPSVTNLIEVSLMLAGGYIGLIVTIRGADEISVSLPFFKFEKKQQRLPYFLLDSGVLADPRIVDLATSGILDQRARVPRFVLRELQQQFESPDEIQRATARRALDVVKKLEELAHLELEVEETDYHDLQGVAKKLTELARQHGATILTADMNRIEISAVDGVRIVNIHQLSNALKPLTQAGECIQIKVQRPGKEPKQGVGYLEDGTMVVINGGGEYIGETVRAQVLSVKHTSSGRMVFCNALAEEHAHSVRNF